MYTILKLLLYIAGLFLCGLMSATSFLGALRDPMALAPVLGILVGAAGFIAAFFGVLKEILDVFENAKQAKICKETDHLWHDGVCRRCNKRESRHDWDECICRRCKKRRDAQSVHHDWEVTTRTSTETITPFDSSIAEISYRYGEPQEVTTTYEVCKCKKCGIEKRL